MTLIRGLLFVVNAETDEVDNVRTNANNVLMPSFDIDLLQLCRLWAEEYIIDII